MNGNQRGSYSLESERKLAKLGCYSLLNDTLNSFVTIFPHENHPPIEFNRYKIDALDKFDNTTEKKKS